MENISLTEVLNENPSSLFDVTTSGGTYRCSWDAAANRFNHYSRDEWGTTHLKAIDPAEVTECRTFVFSRSKDCRVIF